MLKCLTVFFFDVDSSYIEIFILKQIAIITVTWEFPVFICSYIVQYCEINF